MKSFKEYIFELSDDKYLKLAKGRKQQNKDISNILLHAYNIINKKFIDELKSFEWYKYVNKCNAGNICITLYFDNIMYDKNEDNNDELRKQMHNDIIELCKKYNTFVHGVRFNTHYSNEDPNVEIYIFDRKKHLDIKKDQKLYHITTFDNAKKIIDEGIKTNINNNYSSSYTYKSVFAFKTKKFINYYIRNYIGYKEYCLIEFEAGDNIYFNDWVLNIDLKKEYSWKYREYDQEKIEKNGSDSIFTLEDIDKNQILTIIKIKGNKKEIIYSRDN